MKNIDEFLNESKSSYVLSKYGNIMIFLRLHLMFIIAILSLLVQLAFFRLYKPGKFNKKYTEIIKKITGDDKISVYSFNDSSPNAFYASGYSLYYTTGLEKLLSNEKELTSVLLHEYGHYNENHVTKAIMSTTVLWAFLYVVINVAQKKSDTPMMLRSLTNDYLPLLLFVINTIYAVTYGRKFEYKADSYAKKYGYEKEFIRSLKKIERYIISRLRSELCHKHDTKESCDEKVERSITAMELLDEHPSIKKRIERLKKSIVRAFSKVFIRSGGDVDKLLNLVNKYKILLNKKIDIDINKDNGETQ